MFQQSFVNIYTKFKNGIFNYLGWIKFIQLSKNKKKSGLVKDMFINVSTKYKDIIRITIRNRFVELS